MNILVWLYYINENIICYGWVCDLSIVFRMIDRVEGKKFFFLLEFLS